MKVVIPGGSGQVGRLLARAFASRGDEVVILSRSGTDIPSARAVTWDGQSLGDWSDELEDCDVLINLAGRTVNCRYTDANLKEMMDSRVDSTRVVGQALAQLQRPIPLWLQMSTATIYAHRFDAANDEVDGLIGGQEADVPNYWGYSVEIGKNWEAEQLQVELPHTRKVQLRAAMVMSPDRGGIFDVLYKMTRLRLGGSIAGGRQYVSWIHETDFVNAILWLIEHPEFEGPVNLAAPGPLPQAEFMAGLRKAMGVALGLPAMAWMAEIGAFFMRSDTELLLKSRRVVSSRLARAGFMFEFSEWGDAAQDLVRGRRVGPS